MRRRILLATISVVLASCGGGGQLSEEETVDANLLDPAMVNAILGADIPPDAIAPTNGVEANAADDNQAVTGGNRAD